MSWAMRVLLIIGSVFTAVYVIKKIRRSKMRTEDSVFWLLFSLILVLLGVFPGIAIHVSRIVQRVAIDELEQQEKERE